MSLFINIRVFHHGDMTFDSECRVELWGLTHRSSRRHCLETRCAAWSISSLVDMSTGVITRCRRRSYWIVRIDHECREVGDIVDAQCFDILHPGSKP